VIQQIASAVTQTPAWAAVIQNIAHVAVMH